MYRLKNTLLACVSPNLCIPRKPKLVNRRPSLAAARAPPQALVPLHAPSPRSRRVQPSGGSNGERLEHLQHSLVPHLRAESAGSLSQEPGPSPTLLTGATGGLGRPGQRAVAPLRRHCGIIKAALSTCCGADSARTFSGSSSISMHLA